MYWHLAGLSKSETLALIIKAPMFMPFDCTLHISVSVLLWQWEEVAWNTFRRVLEDSALHIAAVLPSCWPQSTDQPSDSQMTPSLSFSTQVACRKWGDSSRTMTEFMKGWKITYTKSSVNLWSLDGNKRKWPLRNLMAWFLYREWKASCTKLQDTVVRLA